MSKETLVPTEIIQNKIYLIRSHKVMLDRNIAVLYSVKPIALRQQVKRNKDRFPEDFMFQLTDQEAHILLSQNVIPSIQSLGGALPYAFTEQGVAMLSSVLKSKRAVQVNIQIMRVFTKLREIMLSHKDLARKIDDLERKFETKFQNNDKSIMQIFNTLRQLMESSKYDETIYRRTKIGFIVDKETAGLKSLARRPQKR
jgi:hypothetical protein